MSKYKDADLILVSNTTYFGHWASFGFSYKAFRKADILSDANVRRHRHHHHHNRHSHWTKE
jgi:hypothetical protein